MDKQEAYVQWRSAVIALTNCWDSLRELENELGTEVETDEIQTFAGDDNWTEEAFDEFLEQIKERDAERCDCADRSWYGAVHDSACALAGQPNPNSPVRR